MSLSATANGERDWCAQLVDLYQQIAGFAQAGAGDFGHLAADHHPGQRRWRLLTWIACPGDLAVTQNRGPVANALHLLETVLI
jgi:hypothetical protein